MTERTAPHGGARGTADGGSVPAASDRSPEPRCVTEREIVCAFCHAHRTWAGGDSLFRCAPYAVLPVYTCACGAVATPGSWHGEEELSSLGRLGRMLCEAAFRLDVTACTVAVNSLRDADRTFMMLWAKRR